VHWTCVPELSMTLPAKLGDFQCILLFV
jgi:hypothetical protein